MHLRAELFCSRTNLAIQSVPQRLSGMKWHSGCASTDVRSTISRTETPKLIWLGENLLHRNPEQGKIDRISEYNPVELFSDDQSRMKAALKSLWATPQNNLRLFIDSKPVTRESWEVTLSSLLDVHVESLLEILTETLARLLHSSGVLSQILKVQKLDTHGIDYIHAVYFALCEDVRKYKEVTSCNHAAPDESLGRKFSIGEDRRPVSKADNIYGKRALEHSTAASASGIADPVADDTCGERAIDKCEDQWKLVDIADLHTADQDVSQISDAQKACLLRGYLIAGTAKDCSIMIAMRPLAPTESSDKCLEIARKQFVYRIGIVDLDRKDAEKIAVHYEQEHQILMSMKLT